MSVIMKIEGASAELVDALSVHEVTDEGVALCYSVQGNVDVNGWIKTIREQDCRDCAQILEMKWPTK